MTKPKKNNSVIILSKYDISLFHHDVEITITRAHALLEDHFTKRVESSHFAVKCLCELLLSAYSLREYLDILFPDPSRSEYEVAGPDLQKLSKVSAVIHDIKGDLQSINLSMVAQ